MGAPVGLYSPKFQVVEPELKSSAFGANIEIRPLTGNRIGQDYLAGEIPQQRRLNTQQGVRAQRHRSTIFDPKEPLYNVHRYGLVGEDGTISPQSLHCAKCSEHFVK